MTAGLPLINNGLTLFAKSVLIPLGLLAVMSEANAAIQRKKPWIKNYCIINLNRRNGRHNKNS